MPAQEHLWRHPNSGIYYFRMVLPRSLMDRKIPVLRNGNKVWRELRFSLKTSNHKSAGSLAAYHTAIWRAKLDEEIRKVEEAAVAKQAKELLFAAHRDGIVLNETPQKRGTEHLLSDEFIQRIVIRHFIVLQKESARRLDDLKARPELKDEVIHDIALETHLTREEGEADSRLRSELRGHLEVYGLEGLSESSEEFVSLLRGYRAAMIEDAQRTLTELAEGAAKQFDPMFKDYGAWSSMPDAKAEFTLGDLISEFDKSQRKKRVSFKTHRTNAPVFLALREYFGDKMPAAKMTASTMTAFFDFLDTVPAHASKRYPGKSLKEAVSLAAKAGNLQLLGHRTKANYQARVVAMFEYARSMGWVTFNPASIRPLVARFHVEKKSDREPFSEAELSTIFHAPLYTGCKSDEKTGWYQKGDQISRRGRFWVPLLALFEGFRCNEACQIEVQDVIEKDGVPCIAITDESDDPVRERAKSVKNSSSRSMVPIHPTIIRMGFLEFVKDRRAAGDDSRLFPELPHTREGSYADIFSKWFNRFLEKTFPSGKPKGTFHSFRHAFRDATRRAKLHPEIADRLGRWASSGGVGVRYGAGFTMPELFQDLKKVQYPGVDFSHLMTHTESGCPMRVRV